MYIQVYVYIYIHTYIHTHIHTYIHTYIHVRLKYCIPIWALRPCMTQVRNLIPPPSFLMGFLLPAGRYHSQDALGCPLVQHNLPALGPFTHDRWWDGSTGTHWHFYPSLRQISDCDKTVLAPQATQDVHSIAYCHWFDRSFRSFEPYIGILICALIRTTWLVSHKTQW